MSVDRDLMQAEKVLAAIQLIAENGEEVANSKLASGRSKMVLKNMAKQSEKLIDMLYRNMDDPAVMEFNNLVREIEVKIEQHINSK